jgi:hypothetical protein
MKLQYILSGATQTVRSSSGPRERLTLTRQHGPEKYRNQDASLGVKEVEDTSTVVLDSADKGETPSRADKAGLSAVQSPV